jgi:hypothetical protein
MSRFTTRIELHKAKLPEDYEDLHKLMAKEGFSRTIIDKDGVEYRMPSAEYNKVAENTIDEVYNAAERAAKATGKGHWILVTEGSRKWVLEPVKKLV